MNDPTTYVKVNSMQAIDVRGLLEEYKKYLEWTEGERILDIGCGPGDLTSKVLLSFLPKGAKVVGCDISEAMITHANKYCSSERVIFKQLDISQKIIDKASWKPESFNKIFSFYCLHWVQDRRQAIRNINSLLKPKGDILLMFAIPDNPIYLAIETLRLSEKWKLWMKKREWFYEMDNPITNTKEILREFRFENIKCYLKQGRYQFSSWNTVMGLLKSVNPYLDDVPEDMRSEYLNEVGNSLLSVTGFESDEDNGIYVSNYNLLIAYGKKPA